MSRYIYIIIGIALALLSACSDDDTRSYPPLLTDLADVRIDAMHKCTSMTLDDGTKLAILNPPTANAADTIMRCICRYTLEEKQPGHVTAYAVQPILADTLIPAAYFLTKPTAKVDFVSAWRTSRYINYRLGIKTTNTGAHAFAFKLDSMTTASTGTTTAHATLIHRRPNNDAESFTQEVFLSLLFPQSTPDQQAPDSIALSINTYEGLTTVVR